MAAEEGSRAARQRILENLDKILNNPENSDFVIYCKDKKFYVQKAIIGLFSEYWANACSKKFKEGQTGEITLEEDDPAAVKAMVQFLYTGNYTTADSSLLDTFLHIEVSKLGRKYLLPDLKQLALDKWTENRSWMYDNVGLIIIKTYEELDEDVTCQLLRMVYADQYDLFHNDYAYPGVQEAYMEMFNKYPQFCADWTLFEFCVKKIFMVFPGAPVRALLDPRRSHSMEFLRDSPWTCKSCGGHEPLYYGGYGFGLICSSTNCNRELTLEEVSAPMLWKAIRKKCEKEEQEKPPMSDLISRSPSTGGSQVDE